MCSLDKAMVITKLKGKTFKREGRPGENRCGVNIASFYYHADKENSSFVNLAS